MQKSKRSLLVFVALFITVGTSLTFLGLATGITAGRAAAITCPDGSTIKDEFAADCPPAPTTVPTVTDPDAQNIYNFLGTLINFLSGVVALVVIVSIIIGGMQYTSAGADAQKVSAAKERIRNAVIALLAFIFMWSFLQWLIPGGILS